MDDYTSDVILPFSHWSVPNSNDHAWHLLVCDNIMHNIVDLYAVIHIHNTCMYI